MGENDDGLAVALLYGRTCSPEATGNGQRDFSAEVIRKQSEDQGIIGQ